MRCHTNQLFRGLFEVWQKGAPCELEELAQRIRSYFFFDSHGRRHIQERIGELFHVDKAIVFVVATTIAKRSCSIIHAFVFRLAKACKHLGHHMLQVRSEILFKDTRHDGKEDVCTFTQTWFVHSKAFHRNSHHVGQVWTEHISAHSLGKGTDRVCRNTTQINLLALLRER